MDFDEEAEAEDEDGLEDLEEVEDLREVGSFDLPFVGGLGAIVVSLMGYYRVSKGSERRKTDWILV